MIRLSRRRLLGALTTLCATPALAQEARGAALAAAAVAQVGVTTGYDPAYRQIAYPGGDVPRSTGVCADVVIRAARDAWGVDLQRAVHEDMAANFRAYPSRRVWGLRRTDRNIDHRRVLNLETYWTRQGARLWVAPEGTDGGALPATLRAGDLVTFLVSGRLPHVGVVTSDLRIAHNIGRGAELWPVADFAPHMAVAHYRWR